MNPGRSADHVYAPIWAHTCAAHTQVTRRAGLRVARVVSSRIFQPRLQAGLDLVADTAEHGEPLRFISDGSGRILERPVQPLHRGRHDRAALVGVVTHGDDTVP